MSVSASRLLAFVALAPVLAGSADIPAVVTELGISVEAASLSVVIGSSSKAKVMGKITSATATGYDTWEEGRSVKVPVYDASGWRLADGSRKVAYYKSEYVKETAKGKPYSRTYSPGRAEVSIPYCSYRTTIDVMNDGQFAASLDLPEGKFFEKDATVQIRPGYTWWWADAEMCIAPQHPKESDSFGSSDGSFKQKIKIWFVDYNDKLCEDLVSRVKIDFAEKNSRVPVQPAAKITPLTLVTFDDFVQKWRASYDEYVVDKLVAKHTEYLRKRRISDFPDRNPVEVTGQDHFEFWSYKGSVFQVETRDRAFYYFKGAITVDKVPETAASVLLVETGGKVRAEDEGKGGEVVTP